MTAASVTRIRPARLRRYSIAGGIVFLLGSVAVLPLLPWFMGIVTDVRHSYTATLPEENRGAYLITDEGVMQVFTWRIDPVRFPEDAAVLPEGAIEQIAVVQKRFDPPENHRLYRDNDREPIPWADSKQDGTQLLLTPAEPLGPGRYELTVPTDSMYGGFTRHFFRIE